MKVTKEEVERFIVLCDFDDVADEPKFPKGSKRLRSILDSWLAQRELLERIAVTRPKDALTYDRMNSLILEARVLVLK